MTWKGKQNMPLERWIRAAVIDKGMAEQAYFTDNFVSFLNDDETDEFDDDEAGSEYTLQVLEEEHDVLCNDMQRILYDAMLAERADTSNEAQHDDIAQHSVEDDTNSDAVEEQQTQLAGENLEAWEVLSFFMATLLPCTFICAALVVIHAAPLTQPTAAAGLPPPPRPAPRPHARRPNTTYLYRDISNRRRWRAPNLRPAGRGSTISTRRLRRRFGRCRQWRQRD